MNRIQRIARKITAGGGAGIDFRIVSTDGFATYEVTADLDELGKLNALEVVPVSNNITIEQFIAEGYMDGGEYAGNWLFDNVVIDEFEQFVSDTLNECHEWFEDKESWDALRQELKDGVKVTVTIADGHSYSKVMGGGYVRSKLGQGDVVEFSNLVGASFAGTQAQKLTGDFDTTVKATLTAEGENWYNTVFIDGEEY